MQDVKQFIRLVLHFLQRVLEGIYIPAKHVLEVFEVIGCRGVET